MPEDFRSRESDGALGDFDAERAWELCSTIVKGGWGWHANVEVKSLTHLVQMLVKAAGRDGNFLLNVGPRPDGTIDPALAQRLREMGAWLSRNGESIYGTRGGPWLPGDYGVSTHRGNFVYVHVLQWPGQTLTLPALPAKVVNATSLNGDPMSFEQDDPRLELTEPSGTREAIDTIIKLELDGPAKELPCIEAVGR